MKEVYKITSFFVYLLAAPHIYGEDLGHGKVDINVDYYHRTTKCNHST